MIMRYLIFAVFFLSACHPYRGKLDPTGMLYYAWASSSTPVKDGCEVTIFAMRRDHVPVKILWNDGAWVIDWSAKRDDKIPFNTRATTTVRFMDGDTLLASRDLSIPCPRPYRFTDPTTQD